MEAASKRNLLIYALVSAISFIYLIMQTRAGIGVPIFVIIQFAFWYYLTPKNKSLWVFIPIFILALNSFISGNSMWHVSNFLVIMLLYSVMILTMIGKFPIKEDSLKFISRTLANVFAPFAHFTLPFKWWDEVQVNKTQIRRILIGIAITVPCLLFLIMMLASADTIFLKGTYSLLNYIGICINVPLIFKIICGIAVGLYLFGLMYIAYNPGDPEEPTEVAPKNGDLIILNILLISVLTVYTLFVFIQFRYLFAGSGHLPYGLTFTEYARKGFFELLFLSGLNILLILITVKLTRALKGLWPKITRYLCHYLCLVTIILLTSSFYRMWLYSSDDGLTRLRLLVFGFLIFEAVGLLITFFYISKPSFNITAVYMVIGLTYYLVLNLVPIDFLVAQNQVDMFLDNRRPDVEYVLTLSPDAAPQVARLLTSEAVDPKVKLQAGKYFERIDRRYHNNNGWQNYNLSVEKAHTWWTKHK